MSWGKRQFKDVVEFPPKVLLEKDEMIVVKSDNVTTHLTICKYEDYQQGENANETQTNRRRTADEIQTTLIEESKESKEEKNNINSRKTSFANSLKPFVGVYSKEMLNEFYFYWTEHGVNDKKMRFEKQTSFDINLRLLNWNKRSFKKQNQNTGVSIDSIKNKPNLSYAERMELEEQKMMSNGK